MGYVIAKIGTSSNVPTWDIRCDTAADVDSLDVNKIPTGSTLFIIDDGSFHMLNSQKQWILQGESTTGINFVTLNAAKDYTDGRFLVYDADNDGTIDEAKHAETAGDAETVGGFTVEDDVPENLNKILDTLSSNINLSIQGNNHQYGYNLIDYLNKHFSVSLTDETVWDFLKNEILENNLENQIPIGGTIPFELDGQSFNAQIAGINTCVCVGGAGGVGRHIDFITIECDANAMFMNETDYNNGTATSSSPWTASELYAYLNAKKMEVMVDDGLGGIELQEVDYESDGLITLLPQEILDVITEKKAIVPTRFNTEEEELLDSNNDLDYISLGKLWIPYETEVMGRTIYGDAAHEEALVQYPIFTNNTLKIKKNTDGDYVSWWTASAAKDIESFAVVETGQHNTVLASDEASFPICFRIGKED